MTTTYVTEGLLADGEISRARIEELKESMDALSRHSATVGDSVDEYLFALEAGDGHAEVMYRIRIEDAAPELRRLCQSVLDALPD